jgi:hypothetical protein
MVEMWGMRRGYCYYCSEFVDDEPIWQVEENRRIACCTQCALDRGIINL